MAVRHTVAHQRKCYNFQKTKWICQRQLILFIFKLPWKETIQLRVERKNFGLSFCMIFFSRKLATCSGLCLKFSLDVRYSGFSSKSLKKLSVLS